MSLQTTPKLESAVFFAADSGLQWHFFFAFISGTLFQKMTLRM